MEDIAPCPFCGKVGTKYYHISYCAKYASRGCTYCGATGPEVKISGTHAIDWKSEADKEWEQRYNKKEELASQCEECLGEECANFPDGCSKCCHGTDCYSEPINKDNVS